MVDVPVVALHQGALVAIVDARDFVVHPGEVLPDRPRRDVDDALRALARDRFIVPVGVQRWAPTRRGVQAASRLKEEGIA